VKLPLSSPQSLYSAVDDLRGTKADREQLEIEVKEVYTYAHIVTVSISIIQCNCMYTLSLYTGMCTTFVYYMFTWLVYLHVYFGVNFS